MADNVDIQTRSQMMSNIRSTNTKPEVYLRKALHRQGVRFRINVRSLPGSPDVVLPIHPARTRRSQPYKESGARTQLTNNCTRRQQEFSLSIRKKLGYPLGSLCCDYRVGSCGLEDPEAGALRSGEEPKHCNARDDYCCGKNAPDDEADAQRNDCWNSCHHE